MKYLFLLLFLTYAVDFYAQSFLYFEQDKGYEQCSLYPKKTIGVMMNDEVDYRQIKQLYVEDHNKLNFDVQQRMIQCFPSVSDDAYAVLRKIACFITITGDGRCIDYHYSFPETELQYVIQWESALKELGDKFLSMDYTPYKLHCTNPKNKALNHCHYVFSLSYLRKHLKK